MYYIDILVNIKYQPSSSRRTNECLEAWVRIVLVSDNSTKNVLSPEVNNELNNVSFIDMNNLLCSETPKEKQVVIESHSAD